MEILIKCLLKPLETTVPLRLWRYLRGKTVEYSFLSSLMFHFILKFGSIYFSYGFYVLRSSFSVIYFLCDSVNSFFLHLISLDYIYIIVACLFLGIMLVIICMVVVKKTKAPSALPDAFVSLFSQLCLYTGQKKVATKKKVTHPDIYFVSRL